MPEDDVTIETPSGPVTLPFEQILGLGRCIEDLQARGKQPTWHFNECRCCISVHDNVEHPVSGWVVGPDGGADWLETPHEHAERTDNDR